MLDTTTTLDYFSSCGSPAAIKARFKELAKTMHPDAGGTHEGFLKLVAARDAAAADEGDADCILDMIGDDE